MKNILIVNSSGQVGGAEKILAAFLRGLDKGLFNSFASVPTEGGFPGLLRREGIPCEVLPGLYDWGFVTRDSSVFTKPAATLNSVMGLLRYAIGISSHIKRVNDDVVLCNGVKAAISGGIAAMRDSKNCVWVIQDILPDNLYRKLFFLSAFILARKIIVISKSIKDTFPRYLQKKVELVYPFLEQDELIRDRESHVLMRKNLNIKDDEIVLGMIGKLFPSKGVDIFLKVFSEVRKSEKNIKAVIAGDAELEGAGRSYVKGLKDLARSLGLDSDVIFLGWQDDVYAVLDAIDILVYSPRRPHGFGRILIEAMSRSKAVIAFAYSDTREIINDRVSGILAAPMDERELADGLKGLVRDKDMIEILGEQARREVTERFSGTTSKNRFNEILTS